MKRELKKRTGNQREAAPDTLALVRELRGVLASKKGESIVLLDMTSLSSLTDYYVIVSGGSAPHLKALTRAVHDAMKPHGRYAYRKSGEPESGWVTLDYIDFVIHILDEELRDYYRLEELWAQAPRVD